MVDSKKYIGTSEAAELIGVSPRRVRQYIAEGRLIPVLRLPQAYLLDRQAVEHFERLPPGNPLFCRREKLP